VIAVATSLIAEVDGWTKVTAIAGVIAAIAGVLATVGAATALYYARSTVRETVRLRHDDARARLLDCLAEHHATVLRFLGSSAGKSLTAGTRSRLCAAIAATGQPLPKCDHFADESDVENISTFLDEVAGLAFAEALALRG
jgi:hypothetical protein